LAGCITGKEITGVEARDGMVLGNLLPKDFAVRLTGKTITRLQRRGKAIIIELSSGGFLVVQLAMTGQLIYGGPMPESKVIFKLSNRKYLNYNDQRRFGRLSVFENLDQMKFLQSLGPEPLGGAFGLCWFAKALKKKAAPIKTLLMNQSFIAGIGNIYASEILFRAKINPKRPARALKPDEIKRLRRMTINVLKEAIRLRGSSVNTYRDAKGERGFFINRIKVYGRDNEKCVLCGSLIARIILSGRSTFFCRKCQA